MTHFISNNNHLVFLWEFGDTLRYQSVIDEVLEIALSDENYGKSVDFVGFSRLETRRLVTELAQAEAAIEAEDESYAY